MIVVTPLGAGIISSGWRVLDRSSGRLVPYRRPTATKKEISRPAWQRTGYRPRYVQPRRYYSQPRRKPIARRQARRTPTVRKPTRSRAEIQAQGQKRLQAARVRSDAARLRKQQENAARREAAKQKAAERAAKKPPKKSDGIRKWEQYYAKHNVQMPVTVRETIQQREKLKFFRAVTGKWFVQRQPGKNYQMGIGWMFNLAYDGETMPYWNAWYDGSMTAKEIGYRVAADYMTVIKKKEALQRQYDQQLDRWEDTEVGTRPQLSRYVPEADLAPVQVPGLPDLPLPSPGRGRLPELPPIPGKGQPFMELPPLI